MKTVRTVLIPGVAVIITILVIWYPRLQPPPAPPDREQVRREAELGGYRLIDTEKLGELHQAGSGGIRLVDTRQEWEYRAGHMKGAANFPMEPTWWARWRGKRALAEFLGPDKLQTIVFY